MKQVSIQITVEAEKLRAIKQFMALKEADLDTELNGLMDKLYKQHVPPSVRLYIDGRPEDEPVKPPRRPSPPKTEPVAAPVGANLPRLYPGGELPPHGSGNVKMPD